MLPSTRGGSKDDGTSQVPKNEIILILLVQKYQCLICKRLVVLKFKLPNDINFMQQEHFKGLLIQSMQNNIYFLNKNISDFIKMKLLIRKTHL